MGEEFLRESGSSNGSLCDLHNSTEFFAICEVGSLHVELIDRGA